MKRLSQKTSEVIRGLYAGEGFWGKLIGRQDPPLSAFDEIASSGEALAIPHLTTFLLNERSDVREATARTIGRLITNVASADFAQLDEACRNDWSYESSASSVWHRLKPTDVKQFWRLPSAVAIVGVASCHCSGFVRDAAVNELANIFDGSELPFLLVRLNDWVQVVREAAATAVLRRVRPDYATHFFRHLRLVYRLRSCGRSQHDQIVTAVTALLQEPSAASILREGIQSNDRWLRRESFRMAIAARSDQSTNLLKEMLSDSDPIMRLWATRNVVARLNDEELQPLLFGLVHDRFMPVRCEALNLLAQRATAAASDCLADALLDIHSSVRAVARHWIRTRQPEFDFASVYRHSLGVVSPVRQRAAILGLSETGTPADAEAMLPFLEAPFVSTRTAAIRALAALGGERYVEEFVAALTDEHPGISNEATRALANRASLFTESLQSLFRAESRPHVRKNVFKLLTSQPFWARGIFLFEALRDRDEHIIESGRCALRDWLMRSRSMATGPNPAELQQLWDSVKASAGMLTSSEVKELEFCLKTYK
jgi:HEAT repeat protein